MNKLLLNEHPLIMLPTLACVIGLNESLFLQQLHYWLLKSTTIFDNQKWVYKTIEEWEKEFPFWSKSTLKRAIASLKKREILIIKKLSQNRRERTNYYTIDYNLLRFNLNQTVAQNEPMNEVNMNPKTVQSESMARFKMTPCIYNENQRDYTETTTENKKIYKKSPSQKPKKLTWEQVAEKEKILAEIKKMESPLLPIEQFINSLLANQYQYVDFVKAYQVWVSRAKSKVQQRGDSRNLTATEIIAMRKKELGL